MSLTPDVLAMVAAAVLSLVMSYVPGLSDKFATLDPVLKRGIMAGLVVVVAAAAFGLQCVGLDLGVAVVCSKLGAWDVAKIVILALIANQATYQITPSKAAIAEYRAKQIREG